MPENEGEDRPRARRPRRDDDDFDDHPRRSRHADETGGIIPYKNPKALAAYYCGVFGLISCFILFGIFGVVPIVLGIKGLKHAKKYPESSGQVHAIIGIVLGTLEVVTFLASIIAIVVAATQK
jgi:hypothetical protein